MAEFPLYVCTCFHTQILQLQVKVSCNIKPQHVPNRKILECSGQHTLEEGFRPGAESLQCQITAGQSSSKRRRRVSALLLYMTSLAFCCSTPYSSSLLVYSIVVGLVFGLCCFVMKGISSEKRQRSRKVLELRQEEVRCCWCQTDN